MMPESPTKRDRPLALIADDDRMMRLLLRGALERAGFAVMECENGRQAVDAFPEAQPNLVVLNGLMPLMDGFTTCAAIRARPDGKYVPILLVTGLEDTASIRRAYEVGATDFASKPVNWTILGYRAQYMLRASHTLQALRRSEEHNGLLLEQAQHTAERLRQAKQEAEAADRIKSEFLATISHELRTPLHIILGYGDLLLDEAYGGLTTEQARALQRMRRSARNLLELITSVLDVRRLAAGQMPVAIEIVQISDILQQVENDLQELREQSPLQFVWKTEANLPPLQTDGEKLKLILKNLLTNAVKFTERGVITVVACQQTNGVEISVSDTGSGIPSEALTRIFEPFQRLDGVAVHSYGGTGLGLHIVTRLLDLLGGRVQVESQVGCGSTFRVWLPLRVPSVG
jgi:signal transduction histidine kinase